MTDCCLSIGNISSCREVSISERRCFHNKSEIEITELPAEVLRYTSILINDNNDVKVDHIKESQMYGATQKVAPMVSSATK